MFVLLGYFPEWPIRSGASSDAFVCRWLCVETRQYHDGSIDRGDREGTSLAWSEEFGCEIYTEGFYHDW